MIKHSFLATFPPCYHSPHFPTLIPYSPMNCLYLNFSWDLFLGKTKIGSHPSFQSFPFLLPVNYQVLIIPIHHHHLENLATSSSSQPFPWYPVSSSLPGLPWQSPTGLWCCALSVFSLPSGQWSSNMQNLTVSLHCKLFRSQFRLEKPFWSFISRGPIKKSILIEHLMSFPFKAASYTVHEPIACSLSYIPH